jgi:nucleotide-binding universal stress UspA family protein
MRKILVPVDGSPFAEAAVAPAGRLAQEQGAELHLVSVDNVGGAELVPGSGAADASQHSARKLEALAEGLRVRLGITVATAVARGPVVVALAQYAARLDVGLIVMATHGRTWLGRALAGSVADDLLHATSVPLMLLRVGADGAAVAGPGRRILVGLDGSPAGEQALAVAAGLAKGSAARLLLVHVVVPIPVDVNLAATAGATLTDMVATQRLIDSAQGYLERLATGLRAGYGIAVDVAVEVGEAVSTVGVAARAIVRLVAERRIDLVVLASRERRGSRLLMRSVADRLLHETDCAILLCHHARSASPQAARRTAPAPADAC